MLSTIQLSYIKQGRYLNRDISLEVPEGTFFTIAGPNGAGKSTLMRQLTGAIKPSKGLVKIQGKNLANWNQINLAKIRAVLSQKTQIAFPMSVFDTVMLGRYASEKTSQKTKGAIVEWALNLVNMNAYSHRNIQTLSGGEQQRVHLARVLCQVYETQSLEGKYVFLDEPTSSLDIAQQYHMLNVLHMLSTSFGLTVGVVLHDLHLAARFSDSVFLLKNGSLIASGSPEKTLTKGLVTKVFDLPESLGYQPKFFQQSSIINESKTHNHGLHLNC